MISTSVPAAIRAVLREALLAMHQDREGRSLLAAALVARFTEVKPSETEQGLVGGSAYDAHKATGKPGAAEHAAEDERGADDDRDDGERRQRQLRVSLRQQDHAAGEIEELPRELGDLVARSPVALRK